MDFSRTLRLAFFASLALSFVMGLLGSPAAHAGADASARLSNARAPSTESPVVYPRERLPLRFDHRRHVKKTGLTCPYCHTAATTSRASTDRLLPEPSRCDACHGTDHDDLAAVEGGVGDAKECSFCHEGHRPEDGNRVMRLVVPTANLKFDHRTHVARGVACAECHAGVGEVALATRSNLPTMRSCFRCHGGDAPVSAQSTAPGKCSVCHLTNSSGRLRTTFATGTLLPPRWLHDAEHGADWVERHKTVAGADSAFCATCHSEQECVDCHDGRMRPRRVHPNDWISMHPVAARQGAPDCSSCHRAQSFCITCHERAGVAESAPTGDVQSRGRFHPPRAIWSDPPRTAGHHAWEAERNISACVSCHTERDCALCHGTAARGGRGGLSPHPVGFDASCRGAMARNARPCFVCHDAGDPVLARCR